MAAKKIEREYTVSGMLTISVHTKVRASSAKEAVDAAKDHPVMTLCGQCSRGDPNVEWVSSGELDGDPRDLAVEVA